MAQNDALYADGSEDAASARGVAGVAGKKAAYEKDSATYGECHGYNS